VKKGPLAYEYPFAFSVMSVIPQSQERIYGWPPYPS